MLATPQSQSPRAPFMNADECTDIEAAANQYTSEYAVAPASFEPQRCGSALWGSIFLSLGTLLAGYADGLNSLLDIHGFCTRTPERTLECTDEQWYRLAYTIGSVLGALLAGFVVADRYGRKANLAVGSLVFVGGGAFTVAIPPQHVVLPLLARGVQGVGTSMIALGVPLLCVEIAGNKARGFLGALFFLMLYAGMFLWLIARNIDDFGETRWQAVHIGPVTLAIGLVAGVFGFVPESERWQRCMKRSQCVSSGGDDRINGSTATPPVKRTLAEGSILRRVAIATLLLSLQQLFALVNLAQMSDILQDIDRAQFDAERKLDISDMLAHSFNSNNAAIAMLIAIPSLITMYLMDKAGRLPLLLIGAVLMAICHPAVASSMDNECTGDLFQRNCGRYGGSFTLMSIAAVGCYGLSWGPVMWIYPFEMFPTEVRAKGVALATVLSTALATSVKEFGLETAIQPYVTIPCAVLAIAIASICCHETKKLSLEDAAAKFDKAFSSLR